MSKRIVFDPHQGQMSGSLRYVSAFPGENFQLGIPEFVGDAAQVCTPADVTLTWSPLPQGVWTCVGHADQELSYTLTVTPDTDTVDIEISLTNESTRPWAHSLAFNCFNPIFAPSVADFECVRHWTATHGGFSRLIQLPRKYSERPTVQVYSVEGAPWAMTIPFAAAFHATPDVVVERWLAIQSRDGTRLVATVSKPTLFLFQNMEYSCIHSAPSFGALQPGQTGQASTRLYLVQSTLADWYQRMIQEY